MMPVFVYVMMTWNTSLEYILCCMLMILLYFPNLPRNCNLHLMLFMTSDWNLTVNAAKAKIAIFFKAYILCWITQHFSLGMPIWKWWIITLIWVQYLMLMDLSVEIGINKQSRVKKKYYALVSKIRKLRLPVDLSLELFDQLVWPVLTYGCKVWGFSNINQINGIQRKFIKSFLRLNSSTTNSMIYGETGTLPVAYHIKSRMINFFMRLLNVKQSKLSSII